MCLTWANLDGNICSKELNNYCIGYMCYTGEHLIIYRNIYTLYRNIYTPGTILNVVIMKGGHL